MRHYQEQLKQEEGEARARWENSGMSVADYIRSRAEEGEPAFDLDWEMMRQLEHDQAQGMFQINKEARDSRSFGSDTAASAEASVLIRRSVTAVRDSLTTVESIPNLPKKVNTAIEGIRKSIESIATGEKIKGLSRPVNVKNLLTSLSVAGFHRPTTGGPSAYLMLKDRSIRISDHSADAWRFKRDNNLSIKLSRPKANKPFNASANNNVIEATYGRRFLEEHPDVLARMLRDVAEFAATGEFHDTAGASKVEFSGEQEYKNNAIKILIEDARKRNDTQAEQTLIQQLPENLRMDVQAQGTGKGVGRFQIERLYTGSATDYANRVPVLDKDGKVTGYRIDNKPSLIKIGTGEGSQTYGYGLYASDRRGVAGSYAKIGSIRDRRPIFVNGEAKQLDSSDLNVDDAIVKAWSYVREQDGSKDKAIAKMKGMAKLLGDSPSLHHDAKILQDAIKYLETTTDVFKIKKAINNHKYIYEQTWFTNRAKDDESHLLNWYEMVSGWQKDLLENALSENGVTVKRVTTGPAYNRGTYYEKDGKLLIMLNNQNAKLTGELAYQLLAEDDVLGSPKAASEWLAAHDIDGIKYPVGSYGKTVKDGDKVGWNYVSFRDDNIRVDHKWVDGVAKFGIAPSALGNGKQKYYEVPFEKAVDKIVKAGAPIGRDQVFVSETPEVFAKIGLTKLPIMMTQKHVLTICNDANTLSALGIKGNAHDMERVLKQIPRAIKNPLMIIASTTKAENSIVAITALKDKTGKTVIAPIVLNGTSRTGNTWIDSHILATTYGKDNTWSKLVVDALQDEANGKVAVFYIDTTRANLIKNQLARVEKSGANGVGKARLQLPRGQHRADLVHSITDPGSPVKGAMVARNWAGEVYRVCVIGITDVKLYENENAAGSLLAHKLRGHLREFTYDILSHYIRKGKGVNLENLETCSNHLDCEIRKYYTTNPESDISKVNCQVWKRNNSQRKSRIV